MYSRDHLITGYVGRIAFLVLFFIIGGFVGTGVGGAYESARIAESQKVETAVVSSSTTTTSEPADWKTYSDPTYYYSIKYPMDWEVKKITPGPGNEYLLSWQGVDPIATSGDYLASVRVSPKTVADEVASAKSFVSTNDELISSETSIFNTYNATALKIKNKSNNIVYATYYIAHNGYTYIVNGLSTSDEVNDKIAQTVANSFKFTDLKTYTNTKYGFSIIYPNSWIAEDSVSAVHTNCATICASTTFTNSGNFWLQVTNLDGYATLTDKTLRGYVEYTQGKDGLTVTKVGGNDVIKMNKTNPDKSTETLAGFFLKSDSKVIEVFGTFLKDDATKISVLNDMLSTFKFTDLKTYTSAFYGFSFQYPSVWNDVKEDQSAGLFSIGIKGGKDYDWGFALPQDKTIDAEVLGLQNGDKSVVSYTVEPVTKFGSTGKKVTIKTLSTGESVDRYVMQSNRQSLKDLNQLYVFDGSITAGTTPLSASEKARSERIATALATLVFTK